MKGRDTLFSAFKEVDLTTLLLVGANAAAEPARRERAAIFIMVAVFEFIPCCCEAVYAVKTDTCGAS
jgi:hypothetical protein